MEEIFDKMHRKMTVYIDYFHVRYYNIFMRI